MSEISRVALFGKLNPLGYKAVESATVFCKMRGNPYVELVHWLHQIVQGQDSDIHRIIDHYDLDPGKVAAQMTRALDALPRGASSITDLSEHMTDAVERAWTYASLLYSSNQVRTGHLILGILRTDRLKNVLAGISEEFAKIKADDLAENFAHVTEGSPEERMVPQDGSRTGGGAVPGEVSGAMAPAAMGKEEALKQFCVDLTEQARNGEIDPIVGRDEEIRQIVDVLMRRRQNNPDPDRRGRGRKNGRRGRVCAPDRAGRRATGAIGRAPSGVGRRSSAGRRLDERRVRAAAALGDRRGPGEPDADHHVH